MSKVMLKYWFIFDPNKVWNRQDAFNADLNKMLRSKGLKAEEVDTLQYENTEEVILYIEPDEAVDFERMAGSEAQKEEKEEQQEDEE